MNTETFHCALLFFQYIFLLRFSTAEDAINITNEHIRIVGGQTASKNEFPWLVNLLTNEGQFCGGALIDARWVLTAAHCVEGAYYIDVIAGDHDLEVEEVGEQKIRSCRLIHHSEYQGNDRGIFHDIALIKLRKPFTLTQFVKTLQLPPSSFNIAANDNVTVAGWGTLTEGDKIVSRYLQKVVVKVTENFNCSLVYPGVITENVICAGMTGKDSCQGDSGGPLHCSSAEGATYVCAIVSFGRGCGRPNIPGVYTKVTPYLNWIQDVQDALKDDETTYCSAAVHIHNNFPSMTFMIYSFIIIINVSLVK